MSLNIKKNRKVVKTVTLEHDDSPVTFQIVKPTMGDRLRALEKAQQAGQLDADGRPVGTINQMRVSARMMVVCLYQDGQPVFGLDNYEDALELDCFEELAQEIGKVFNPDEEKLRGNS